MSTLKILTAVITTANTKGIGVSMTAKTNLAQNAKPPSNASSKLDAQAIFARNARNIPKQKWFAKIAETRTK
jgi:hypothetical protein